MDFHITAPTTKFTGKTDDWEVFLHFQCDNKRQALAIERHVKQMKSKVYIQNLKKFPELITKLRAKYS